MVGTFRELKDAEEALKAIEAVKDYVLHNEYDYANSDRYPEGVLKLLQELQLYVIQPRELDQFLYEFHVKTEKKRVIVTTDETEISGIMKILIENGGWVEVYSAHQYSDTGEGR